MTWAYYTVTTSLGRRMTLRGISERDVAYVFHNPCKRNQQTTLAKANETIVSLEKVA
jgi:hypothetical protein